jgi:hypothetical protein
MSLAETFLLAKRQPAYDCMDAGGRAKQEHLPRGGMTLIQAFVWNLGTCRSDAKGESQAEAPWSDRVPMRSTGADQLVVAMKSL